MAPALNGGTNRSPESIITAVLDPNAAVESVFHTYRVIKQAGYLQGKSVMPENMHAARLTRGKAIFMICAACHAPGKDQPGPSLEEIAKIYDNKKDLIQWIVKPGKKREKYPQMPGFPHMDEESLALIAEYLLSLKKK